MNASECTRILRTNTCSVYRSVENSTRGEAMVGLTQSGKVSIVELLFRLLFEGVSHTRAYS